jgi:hypothetical protein
MKKNVNADLKKFYCTISFVIECSKVDFEKVVQHYQDLFAFYNIEGTISSNDLIDVELSFEHFSFSVIIQKDMESYYLSTVALRNIFLNDLEIIRQLHYISEAKFECPILSQKLF